MSSLVPSRGTSRSPVQNPPVHDHPLDEKPVPVTDHRPRGRNEDQHHRPIRGNGELGRTSDPRGQELLAHRVV
ncbi:MAG TPA: hypothetical protein ENN53_06425 [Candidatus Acetothermia bacterium]|nr:hypothetical protein [Candidatus Acetothermia bacterium]